MAGIATYAFTLQQLKCLRNKNEMNDDLSNTIALAQICIEHVHIHLVLTEVYYNTIRTRS